MERIIAMRNSRGEYALRLEKATYIFLGIITYIVGHIKTKLSSSDVVCRVFLSKKSVAEDIDKETALADFCAVCVAFTVATVVYVTMLFCVGEGYSNGVGTEILVSGGIFAIVYSVIRFLTSVK